MEIIPGIHAVKDVYGAKSFLLVDDTLTLIDTGYQGNSKKILDYISSIGENPQKLSRIVVTHYHPDHVGSAYELIKSTPAKVLIHPADVRRVSRDKYGLVVRLHRIGRIYKKWRVPLLPTSSCEFIEEGDIIPCLGGLRVIHTPGHSPGNISLYLINRRILFTGDTVVNTPRLLLAYLPVGGNHQKSVASLKKITALNPQVCLFSHGQPLFEEVPSRLKKLADNPIHFTVRRWLFEMIIKHLQRTKTPQVKWSIPSCIPDGEPIPNPVVPLHHT